MVSQATPRKLFVLDTNVLLSDVNAIDAFEDNEVVIPLAVLEELDHNKKRMDEVGRNARTVARQLDSMRDLGSLYEGVPTTSGGKLRIVANPVNIDLPKELDASKNDNLIISTALHLKLSISEMDVILVSKDINVRVKCDAIGLKAQDYLKNRAASQAENLYSGVSTHQVTDETMASFWEECTLSTKEVGIDAYPNEIVILKNTDETDERKTTITRCVNEQLQEVRQIKNVFGLKPRNKEQNFALDLLLDDNVKLVTLVGAAGCGKTLIALAAGLEMVTGPHAKYDKMVVTRPIEPVGRDIGYLPGTMEEKMAPWIAPIRDNLEFLVSNKNKRTEKQEKSDPYVDLMFQNGKIEIEAVTYIRGRSIPNSYILIDEAQNLTVHQLKTIITRSGENTKIVLSGDIQQIDVSHMDAVSNGLSYVIEKFKDKSFAGHVTLLKGERSELATIAATLL